MVHSSISKDDTAETIPGAMVIRWGIMCLSIVTQVTFETAGAICAKMRIGLVPLDPVPS